MMLLLACFFSYFNCPTMVPKMAVVRQKDVKSRPLDICSRPPTDVPFAWLWSVCEIPVCRRFSLHDDEHLPSCFRFRDFQLGLFRLDRCLAATQLGHLGILHDADLSCFLSRITSRDEVDNAASWTVVSTVSFILLAFFAIHPSVPTVKCVS
ncbi:hypothetical protein RvY_14273 [Ramazzottius varieornatus]|uniref:Secreted protein n=1 Tax=Ramazzottius varieornatus TaxID=947166 RepID=A0A1D1VZ70_RAMVA|nr:hypothetical protein RvY_14273 [Ramazzottius varieornatus]